MLRLFKYERNKHKNGQGKLKNLQDKIGNVPESGPLAL